jgi:hypothetical protein
VSQWFERKDTCPICKRKVGCEEESENGNNQFAQQLINENPGDIFDEWESYEDLHRIARRIRHNENLREFANERHSSPSLVEYGNGHGVEDRRNINIFRLDRHLHREVNLFPERGRR